MKWKKLAEGTASEWLRSLFGAHVTPNLWHQNLTSEENGVTDEIEVEKSLWNKQSAASEHSYMTVNDSHKYAS